MLTPEQIAACGSEDAHQIALFAMINSAEIKAKYPELQLAFHIPNGGARDKRTAGKLKAAGVKAGVWDIFLPIPVAKEMSIGLPQIVHGLWIEMKVKPNKLTDEQHAFYCSLQSSNFDWFVAYAWREALDKMISYLGGPR